MTTETTETLDRALSRLPVRIREAVRQELADIEPSAITLQHVAEAADRVLTPMNQKGAVRAMDFGRPDVYGQLAGFWEYAAERARSWQAVHVNMLEVSASLTQLAHDAKNDNTELYLAGVNILTLSLFHKVMGSANAPVDPAVFCWRYVEELRQIDREYQARHAKPQAGVAQSS